MMHTLIVHSFLIPLCKTAESRDCEEVFLVPDCELFGMHGGLLYHHLRKPHSRKRPAADSALARVVTLAAAKI